MFGLILSLLGGTCLGFATAWLILRTLPQDKIRKINYEALQQEQELFEHQRIQNLNDLQEIYYKRDQAIETYEDYKDRVTKLVQQKAVLEEGMDILTHMQEEITAGLERQRKDAERSAELFKQKQLELAQEQFDRAIEQMAIKYQNDEADYQEQYLLLIKEYANNFSEQMASLHKEFQQEETKLLEMRNTVDAAVQAAKREEEKRQKSNFYRLVLPESDLSEIAQLRAVEPYLRDKEALNKVIWKVYYEKPCTDLIGRVIGNSIKTGIYKITNIENEMCYVGQAVDVASRWKQHIKRGLGAETPTRNKLYPAMSQAGVENFTFELIEECEKDKLDAREDFWQDYFQAKVFGYSIK